MFAAHVGRCVEVGYKTYGGHFLVDVARQSSHKVAIVIKGDIF